MSKLKPVQRIQRGFTLIEIMVVVAIIGILAAIGMPTLTAYIRTAETTEAVETMERINKALKGVISSRAAGITNSSSAINANNVLSPNSTASTLSNLIPHLSLDSDAVFSYTVDTGVLNGDLTSCILATGITGAGNVGGQIMMSSQVVTSVASVEWENYIQRVNYVDGTALAAGGCCTAAGAVPASCGG